MPKPHTMYIYIYICIHAVHISAHVSLAGYMSQHLQLFAEESKASECPRRAAVGAYPVHTPRSSRRDSEASVRMGTAATSSAAPRSPAGKSCFPSGFLFRPLCEHIAATCRNKSSANHVEQPRKLKRNPLKQI